MNIEPRILVVGATGSLGGAVTTALLKRGVPLTALVRRTHRTLTHPLIQQTPGDLGDRASIRRALEGMTTAFYVSPHSANEIEYAATFVDEAQRAGVRIVFAGVHASRRTFGGRLQSQLIRRLMPAYRDKLTLAADIEERATDAVLFAPTAFFQNDELFLDDIIQGRYPVPIRGFSMISTADVGEIAARALTDTDFPAGSYTLMGPRTLTGRLAATAWTAALGRPVAYTGDDRDSWQATMDRRFPDGRKGSDFRASFTSLAKNRLPTNARHLATTTRLLGRVPQDYADWALHTAARLPATAAHTRPFTSITISPRKTP